MNIKITNKDGLTLHTAHKYCKEDILVTVDESLLESSGSGTLPTLFAPTIRVVDNNLHINDLSNGDFTESYDIYSNDTFLINTENEVLDLSAYISVEGTYSISIIAKSTNFNNSSKSNALDYIYTLELYVSTLEVTLPSERCDTRSAVVGNNAYIFGGRYYFTAGGGTYSGYLDEIIKFDMENEIVTTLNVNLPKPLSNMGIGVVGTNIYILGGGQGSGYYEDIIKLDTLTEEITTLSTKLPTAKSRMMSASVGTNIYLFGGYAIVETQPYTYNEIYKFDTTTGTLTTLSTTMPSKWFDGVAVSIGTDIYIMGGQNESNVVTDEILKFDTLTETIETLSVKLPTAIKETSAVAVGTNIYLFGGSKSGGYSDEIIKFNITSNTTEILSVKLPSVIYGATSSSVERKAYIFGGTSGSIINLIRKVINL